LGQGTAHNVNVAFEGPARTRSRHSWKWHLGDIHSQQERRFGLIDPTGDNADSAKNPYVVIPEGQSENGDTIDWTENVYMIRR
jgi:hypothetical protein